MEEISKTSCKSKKKVKDKSSQTMKNPKVNKKLPKDYINSIPAEKIKEGTCSNISIKDKARMLEMSGKTQSKNSEESHESLSLTSTTLPSKMSLYVFWQIVKPMAKMVISDDDTIEETQLLQNLSETLSCDCVDLWTSLKEHVLHKIKCLTYTGDTMSTMTVHDWLVFDMVLVHQYHDIVYVTDTSQSDIDILVELFYLIGKFDIESLEGDQLADAWSALTLTYNTKGRRCTPMLLQCRWYQLKLVTRTRYLKYWSLDKSNPENSFRAEAYKPTKLQVAIAHRYKSLLTEPFVFWKQLIKQKRVILREQFQLIALKKKAQGTVNDCHTPSDSEHIQDTTSDSCSIQKDLEIKYEKENPVKIINTNTNSNNNSCAPKTPESVLPIILNVFGNVHDANETISENNNLLQADEEVTTLVVKFENENETSNESVPECNDLVSEELVKYVPKFNSFGSGDELITVSDDMVKSIVFSESGTDNSKLKDVKRHKLSSELFQKPRHRNYDSLQLINNPDFNRKNISKTFSASFNNRNLLSVLKPLTIDVSKEFETALVDGKIYLDTSHDNYKPNKDEPSDTIDMTCEHLIGKTISQCLKNKLTQKPKNENSTSKSRCCWAREKIYRYKGKLDDKPHNCPYPICNCCCKEILYNAYISKRNTRIIKKKNREMKSTEIEKSSNVIVGNEKYYLSLENSTQSRAGTKDNKSVVIMITEPKIKRQSLMTVSNIGSKDDLDIDIEAEINTSVIHKNINLDLPKIVNVFSTASESNKLATKFKNVTGIKNNFNVSSDPSETLLNGVDCDLTNVTSIAKSLLSQCLELKPQCNEDSKKLAVTEEVSKKYLNGINNNNLTTGDDVNKNCFDVVHAKGENQIETVTINENVSETKIKDLITNKNDVIENKIEDIRSVNQTDNNVYRADTDHKISAYVTGKKRRRKREDTKLYHNPEDSSVKCTLETLSVRNLLQKPTNCTYNNEKLLKNPDFNLKLRKLPESFYVSVENRLKLSVLKPVTIDVSKEFESMLVDGKINLDSNYYRYKYKNKEILHNLIPSSKTEKARKKLKKKQKTKTPCIFIPYCCWSREMMYRRQKKLELIKHNCPLPDCFCCCKRKYKVYLSKKSIDTSIEDKNHELNSKVREHVSDTVNNDNDCSGVLTESSTDTDSDEPLITIHLRNKVKTKL